jgi:hypothetical protein
MTDNFKITLIAIVIVILGNGIANANNYNGLEYSISGSTGNYTVQFNDQNPNYPSFISKITRINNLSDIESRIDMEYNSAIRQVANGRTTLSGRYNYIYCNYNGSAKNITNCWSPTPDPVTVPEESEESEDNEVIIVIEDPIIVPEYIKKKSGVDKVVMKLENFIKDNGNIYLQKQISNNFTLQYKSEYGNEYAGIVYTKSIDINCKLFKKCINK